MNRQQLFSSSRLNFERFMDLGTNPMEYSCEEINYIEDTRGNIRSGERNVYSYKNYREANGDINHSFKKETYVSNGRPAKAMYKTIYGDICSENIAHDSNRQSIDLLQFPDNSGQSTDLLQFPDDSKQSIDLLQFPEPVEDKQLINDPEWLYYNGEYSIIDDKPVARSLGGVQLLKPIHERVPKKSTRLYTSERINEHDDYKSNKKTSGYKGGNGGYKGNKGNKGNKKTSDYKSGYKGNKKTNEHYDYKGNKGPKKVLTNAEKCDKEAKRRYLKKQSKVSDVNSFVDNTSFKEKFPDVNGLNQTFNAKQLETLKIISNKISKNQPNSPSFGQEIMFDYIFNELDKYIKFGADIPTFIEDMVCEYYISVASDWVKTNNEAIDHVWESVMNEKNNLLTKIVKEIHDDQYSAFDFVKNVILERIVKEGPSISLIERGFKYYYTITGRKDIEKLAEFLVAEQKMSPSDLENIKI